MREGWVFRVYKWGKTQPDLTLGRPPGLPGLTETNTVTVGRPTLGQIFFNTKLLRSTRLMPGQLDRLGQP